MYVVTLGEVDVDAPETKEAGVITSIFLRPLVVKLAKIGIIVANSSTIFIDVWEFQLVEIHDLCTI